MSVRVCFQAGSKRQLNMLGLLPDAHATVVSVNDRIVIALQGTEVIFQDDAAPDALIRASELVSATLAGLSQPELDALTRRDAR